MIDSRAVNHILFTLLIAVIAMLVVREKTTRLTKHEMPVLLTFTKIVLCAEIPYIYIYETDKIDSNDTQLSKTKNYERQIIIISVAFFPQDKNMSSCKCFA